MCWLAVKCTHIQLERENQNDNVQKILIAGQLPVLWSDNFWLVHSSCCTKL